MQPNITFYVYSGWWNFLKTKVIMESGGVKSMKKQNSNIAQNLITLRNEGEGLLFYGNTIIPFKDKFPKDTQLYRIMTTKPNETQGGNENGNE